MLVTSALPYVNADIHLGYMVETIQTDIWVRFQRLRGHRCLYVCADDTHGTATMIRARREGRTEAELLAEVQEAHERDLRDFGISLDNFGSTHSPESEKLCGEIWAKIRAAGLVKSESVEQLFDAEEGVFLADRFVRGTCPQCGAEDQPGDNCSKCGVTYSPAELIDPKSTLSGATPEIRDAEHLFIQLEKLRPFLEEWTAGSGALQPEINNYLQGHFLAAKDEEGKTKPLKDWDISRPAPYFGFEIPDAPGNYWYVWFDAPIGYIASTQQWCDKNGGDLDDWWRSADCEVHHFIGKDITYFHTLFWPGMLKTAGFSLPTKVMVHGFLTVDGEKMSKSKGTFVNARAYLNHLDPAYLRYYYASKLSSKVDDFDLSLDDFVTKVNTDLVGKVVNLASRTAKFVQKTGLSAEYPKNHVNAMPTKVHGAHNVATTGSPPDDGLFSQAAQASKSIERHYERCDYSAAMREIMSLADRANAFIEFCKPWEIAKLSPENSASYFMSAWEKALNASRSGLAKYFKYLGTAPEFELSSNEKTPAGCASEKALQDICTIGLNLYRQIVIYLAPVLPRLAEQTGELLGDPITHWDQAQEPLVGTPVAKFQHLMQRVEPTKVQAMMDESKPEAAEASPGQPGATATGSNGASAPGADADGSPEVSEALAAALAKYDDGPEPLAAEPLAEECVFDDFMKIDLRIARVVEAGPVEGADKLLQLTLSLGGGVTRNVFAGLKKAYQPEDLVGRLVMYVANLAPRKMKFGVSTGMVAASGPGGEEVFLLSPDEGAKPGQRVH